METENVSCIYKPSLVIDHVEVSGATARVTCIECCGSRMFIGTAEGFLIEYFMPDDKTNIHFTRIRCTDLNNKNQSVQFIRSASAIDSLLILSGNYLALFDIQTLEAKGNGLRNITALSVDENPASGDPFVVEFSFSRKTSIHLGQATVKGFNLTREIGVESVALSLSMESGLICAALANGYYIMLNTFLKNSKPIQLCSFDTKDKPQVVHVKKEEFLVLGPGGLGVFVTKDGTSERPPISWPDKVFQINVHNHLNVVAMGQDLIYVHSLVDYATCHTIPFRGNLLKCLSLSEGNLYVVCSRSLFKLNPVSIQDQIETLLGSDEIEKAIKLLQLSHLKLEDHQRLEEKIQRRAVFLHLTNLEFDSAAESLRLSNIDLREVLTLFPNMLPVNSTFTRALPPFHNFIEIRDMTKGDKAKVKQIGTFLARTLVDFDSVRNSKDLSTAVFKLATKYDQRNTFELLVPMTNQLPLDMPDLLEWLESNKFFNSAGQIYAQTGQIGKALNLWISILEEKIFCAAQEAFPGISIIIDTLLKTTDTTLVWSCFEKLVAIDPSAAIQIFTRKPISAAYPPLKVAEKLRKWPQISILYLEHCVEEKDVQDEDCHTYLATMYIDHILTEGNPDVMGKSRLKLRHFLIQSNCLKLQFLIGRLTNTSLRYELAILHGKAGDHKPALLLFTTELKDHKMAREYCTKLKRKQERKEAFLILLGIYLEEAETSPEMDASHEHVVSLLTEFGEEFDLSLVLGMLPDDWSLKLVSNVLFRAVRNTLHKRRQAQLLAGLSRRVGVDVTLRSFNTNQGYIVDSESICQVCHKSFDLNDPIFCKQGFVVHEKCK